MNSPSPQTTTASFEALVNSIASSGLVGNEEFAAAVASSGEDGQRLADILTANGLLTTFQTTAFREQRGDSLRVGNYDILDKLGAGGMGTVFKARHRRMKRIVALKVLAASLSRDEVFVKRFQREVETIAALGHPGIVMAYDADEAEIGHFLVMEFVNGRDLAAYVDREGPISLSRAVNYTLQVARGLAYAHSQGIIHRDIKPHNLLLDDRGAVKVTDLGLARLSHGAEGAASGSELTMVGGVMGTVDYMPPEQAVDSTSIDHRADIYSLGCTLHYLLTGRPPYSGPTIMAILLKHRDAEIPRLSAVRPGTPPQLDDLFRRMLAKRADERVQQMSEVVAQLEAIAPTIGPDQHAQECTSTTMMMPSGIAGVSDATISMNAPPELTVAPEPGVASITVLVVEPSRVQASIIRRYLEEHSVSVAGTVANGTDAISAVQSLGPNVVISAMHLPDINGVELAQRIRTEIRVNAPGFILVTSESDDAESVSLSKLNRVLVLQKPFSSQQLVEAFNLVTGASTPLRPASIASATAQQKLGRADRSKLRVLIADDSSTARIKVRTVLQGLGFSQFLEVPDGAHAIAVAAREICHLIVTDYNMPLMDGRALVSYLKQDPATATIPIVMVTTETDPRILDPVRQLGVVAIVEKAFPASVVGPLMDALF